MLKLDDVYKRVEDKWVSRFIFDEVVIMPLCRTEEDMQYIYSISNETGSKVWQLLDGDHSVQDIQEILKSEYQGQKEVIEREVLQFIGDLFEAKLIGKSGQKKSAMSNSVRQSTIESPQSTVHSPQLKKTYKTPEIARIKMQPEQAVLSCCLNWGTPKTSADERTNFCGERRFEDGEELPPCDSGGAGCSTWWTLNLEQLMPFS